MRIAFRGLGVGPRFITDASRVTVMYNAKGREKLLIAKFVRKDKHIPVWRRRHDVGRCQISTRFPVKIGISTSGLTPERGRPAQVGLRSAGPARSAAARRAWLRPALRRPRPSPPGGCRARPLRSG